MLYVVVLTQWTDVPSAVYGPFETKGDAAAFRPPDDGQHDGELTVLPLTGPAV